MVLEEEDAYLAKTFVVSKTEGFLQKEDGHRHQADLMLPSGSFVFTDLVYDMGGPQFLPISA